MHNLHLRMDSELSSSTPNAIFKMGSTLQSPNGNPLPLEEST